MTQEQPLGAQTYEEAMSQLEFWRKSWQEANYRLKIAMKYGAWVSFENGVWHGGIDGRRAWAAIPAILSVTQYSDHSSALEGRTFCGTHPFSPIRIEGGDSGNEDLVWAEIFRRIEHEEWCQRNYVELSIGRPLTEQERIENV